MAALEPRASQAVKPQGGGEQSRSRAQREKPPSVLQPESRGADEEQSQAGLPRSCRRSPWTLRLRGPPTQLLKPPAPRHPCESGRSGGAALPPACSDSCVEAQGRGGYGRALRFP